MGPQSHCHIHRRMFAPRVCLRLHDLLQPVTAAKSLRVLGVGYYVFAYMQIKTSLPPPSAWVRYVRLPHVRSFQPVNQYEPNLEGWLPL